MHVLQVFAHTQTTLQHFIVECLTYGYHFRERFSRPLLLSVSEKIS